VLNYETFRFERRGDELLLMGRDGWYEPTCPVCGEKIRWCLDMFTFSTGHPFILCHARCSWQPDAFDNQKALSKKLAAKAKAFWEVRSRARV